MKTKHRILKRLKPRDRIEFILSSMTMWILLGGVYVVAWIPKDYADRDWRGLIRDGLCTLVATAGVIMLASYQSDRRRNR